jgi:RecB family exonuclease
MSSAGRARSARASSPSAARSTRPSRRSGSRRIRARAEHTDEPCLETLQEALDRKLASSGLTPDEIEDATRRAVPVLARFIEVDARMDVEPVAVELGFGVAVEGAGDTGGFRFVGYVDRVGRVPDGSTEIIDYKTGRSRSQADVDADT